MDLSFNRNKGMRGSGAGRAGHFDVPVWPFMLAAGAASHASSPTVMALAEILRGQDEAEDWIQTLTQVFAPRPCGMIEAGTLAGSFNPLIASRLMVEAKK